MSRLNPTLCKISTITATGSINSLINLEVFYDNVTINNDRGIRYIEYGRKKHDMIFRGTRGKTPKKKKETKRFDNQVTCLVKSENCIANVKVFKNGKIQMTGLKDVLQGKDIIDTVIDNIYDIYARGHTTVVETINSIMNCDYKIRLINSDFRLGIEIRRDKLNKLIQQTYDVLSSFEPCIYPGVKIQFFWNSSKPIHDGICQCDNHCSGKGDGHGDGECKKITIAVFQSGCIIITGALTVQQIDDAYGFICNVIKNHQQDIEKVPIKSKKLVSRFKL